MNTKESNSERKDNQGSSTAQPHKVMDTTRIISTKSTKTFVEPEQQQTCSV